MIKTPLTKLYYSIGEVADMLNVNSSLIRYWEKEFPQIKPRKNRKGDRMFTQADIQMLVKIYDLVKNQGLTLDGAKKNLKKPKERIDSITISQSSQQGVIKKLSSIKKQLQSIVDTL